jgi:hypothetical protein
MGRGIVTEPDDFRPDNPPADPALLDALQQALAAAHYDLRAVYRLIVASSTYQQSPIPVSSGPETDAQFGRYLVRPLGAEVLLDAICQVTGTTAEYQSPVPEPFTNIPAGERTIGLADGSISSSFLELFGRPARDTGLAAERNDRTTDGQRRFLLNSTDVQRRIEQGLVLPALVRRARGDPAALCRDLYLVVLSRLPTAAESATALAYLKSSHLDPRRATADLMWALINSKEFLFRH